MKTNMTRTHGRCPRGQRLIAKVPYAHWKTLTFVAALRCDGIVAPCVLRQPVNAISFLAWVTQFLVPTLRPGDVVIMDNLSSHKRQAIRAAIRAAGALLRFLPAYSPDLNPSSRCLPRSRPCRARPMLAASKTSMLLSVRCSMSSNQTNVPATLARQAAGQLQASGMATGRGRGAARRIAAPMEAPPDATKRPLQGPNR